MRTVKALRLISKHLMRLLHPFEKVRKIDRAWKESIEKDFESRK